VQLVGRRWLALAAEHAAVEEGGGALPGRGFRGGSAGAAGPGEAVERLGEFGREVVSRPDRAAG
jgi:hypothetical protein